MRARPDQTRTATGATGWRLTPVWAWRAWMLLFSLSALAQPVLAGAYLEGDYDAIGWHSTNGSAALTLLAMGAVGGAVGCALLSRAALWPIPLTVVLFLALTVQIGLGHSRSLLVHVPLGVGLLVAIWALTIWTWSSRLPAGRRPRRRPRAGATGSR